MKNEKWNKNKEFSTETLTQTAAREIKERAGDYEMGRAPVTRNTQPAQDLDDLVEFQKRSRGHDESRMTHGYGAYQEPFEPRPLTPEDDDYEDIIENFTSSPSKPEYWFEEFGDYWSCSCGKLNKGDRCTNCGLERDLLRSLFFLHKPGSEPGEYEGMPIKYEEVVIPKGRLTSRQKLIIAISAVIVLVICAALFSYFYVIKPSIEKEKAEEARQLAEQQQAIAASIGAGAIHTVPDLDELAWNSYVSIGDQLSDKEKYGKALDFYVKARKINETDGLKDKITAAKYGYVCGHKEKGGATFEKYLAELNKAGYKDSQKIYSEYYAWHFSIVANLAAEDYSGDISKASRNDTVYFHVTCSGGAPDETIDVYYEAIWPDGGKEINMLGTGWKNGSREYARFSYTVPLFGKEGKLTFNLYDKNTKELLGSDSITFEN